MFKFGNSNIKKAKFSLMTDEDKKLLAGNTVISHHEIYDGNEKPFINGVYDAKMGPSDGIRCTTCKYSQRECPGHYGRIDLNYPVKTPILIDDLPKWLSIVCHRCSRLIIGKTKLNFKNYCDKVKSIYQTKGGIKCHKCGRDHRMVQFRNNNSLKLVYADEINKEISNSRGLKILDKVRHKFDIKYHPRNLYTQIILVAPNLVRPQTKRVSGSVYNSDELTKLYQIIIKQNNKLKTDDDRAKLDMSYYYLIRGSEDDKRITGEIHKRGALMSFLSKIKGKKGIVRCYTQGKKVGNVLRSVIGGDPTLPLGTISIPQKAAKVLLKKVYVSRYNYEECARYFENGDKYPGAKYLERGDSFKSIQRFKENGGKLKIGDYIYRHTITGDYGLFNRMPSLWWSSVISVKVKVVKDIWTIDFNEILCYPFNGDFDGDEMQLYNPGDDTMIRIELKYLPSLENYAISYMNGGCIIGYMMDTILGSALLTRSNTKLTQNQMYELFDSTDVNPSFDKEIYTGRDVISYLLSEMNCLINYKKDSAFYKIRPEFEDEKTVSIQNGKMLSGILDKNSLKQQLFGNLFHIIHNEKGAPMAMRVAHNLQKIVLAYLSMRGYSLSTKDIVLKNDKQIHLTISEKVIHMMNIQHKYINKELIPPINMSLDSFFEESMIQGSRVGHKFEEKVRGELDKNNNFLMMADVGSKGSFPNLQGIVSYEGQALVTGKRLKKNCNGRSHMFSTRNSLKPEDRGLIKGNLSHGFTPAETAADSQKQREGIVKKSQSTADSGYLNRLMIKALELEQVNNMFGVGFSDNIVLLLYGGDGFDPRYMEQNILKLEDYRSTFKDIDDIYHNPDVQGYLDEEFHEIESEIEHYKNRFLELEKINENYKLSSTLKYPFNIKRIIFNNREFTGKLDPVKAIKDVRDMCENIKYIYTNEYQKGKILPHYMTYPLHKFKLLVLPYLSVKNLSEKKISNEGLEKIIEDIYRFMRKALIAPGTLIGLIMAQSIGQPAMQKMLNSIHLMAQTKSNYETMKDIIQVRKEISAPYMVFKAKNNPENLANEIEMKKFGSFIKNAEAGEAHYTTWDFHKDWNPGNISDIYIKFELNKWEMILKNVSVDKIAKRIYDSKIKSLDDIYIMHNSLREDNVVLIIYFVRLIDVDNAVDMMHELHKNLNNITVDGIFGIKSAVAKKNGFIETDGYNLEEIYNHPNVEQETVYTNYVREIKNKLGIVLAHQYIILELSFQLSGLSSRHYIHLGSSMTYTGDITANNSHGIKNKFKNEVGLKIGTEYLFKSLKDSVRFNQEHTIKGITEPLLYGTAYNHGTNYNKVVLNKDFIKINTKGTSQLIDDAF